MSRARILIVEDEFVVARDIHQQLTALDYQPVGQTADGDEAVRLTDQLRPDLVLMDIHLLGPLDGIEAALAIRERFAIPVIFLTAFTSESVIERAKAAGPFGYIVKPFDERELRMIIEVGLQQHRTELTLRRSEEEMTAVLRSSIDSFWVVNLQGRVLRINDAACQLMGYSREELLQMSIVQLEHGRTLAQIAEGVADVIRLGAVQIERQTRRKDGSIRLVEMSITCTPGPDRLLYCFGRDITERRRAENQLRQLSRAVEQSPASIVITDAAGIIEYVNPHFEKTSGYQANEVIGRNPRLLKSGEHSTEFYRGLWQTITEGGDWSGEFLNRKKNGELFWEQSSISPLRDDQGRIAHFVAVKEDITARKATEHWLLQTQAEMQQANTQLERSIAEARQLAVAAEAANRAKSAFLATMSHELRTPLNVINGVAATLLEQAESAGQKEAARLILEGGANLLGIIEEILDYSGLQAGKTTLNLRAFDLLAIVSHSLRLAQKASQAPQVELSYRIDPAAPAELIGDPRRLQQVLLNLLHNAHKFTERGRVHLGVSARMLPPGSWQLVFTVSDTGRGIAATDQARLFQPFSRIEGGSTRTTGGTGLGLVIARTFAQLMGGDIVVRSQPGRGSSFRFTAVFGAATPSRTVFTPFTPAGLHGRPVLIVTKDSHHRRLLACVAKQWGLRPTVLSLAEASTTALPTHVPGLLAILDQECVRHRGGATARWLAAGGAGHHVPVAWLARADTSALPPTAAPSAVLPLPVDLAELARVLAGFSLQKPTTATAPSSPPGNQPKLGQRLPLRILAADDIRTNREMLRHLMAHLGYTLTLVENGAEVLESLHLQPFDLVLLDIQMPVMDGLTAAREICRRQPDPATRPKLVAITANALPGDREICLAAGMDEYLTKPVLPAQIEACLLQLFAAAPTLTPPVPPTGLPWVDRAHLEAFLPGLAPEELADALGLMHTAAAGDFRQIWPKIVEACAAHNAPGLADLTHGLKGCFLMLGWARAAALCLTVLEAARKGTFTDWDDFPPQLQEAYTASSAAMEQCLTAIRTTTITTEALTPPHTPCRASRADKTSTV
ncbi:MAG: PAS domain S-box protein [Opitutaceae bacterium]|nr:PAS domain S-box protein [Opitutaceae bacterium]